MPILMGCLTASTKTYKHSLSLGTDEDVSFGGRPRRMSSKPCLYRVFTSSRSHCVTVGSAGEASKRNQKWYHGILSMFEMVAIPWQGSFARSQKLVLDTANHRWTIRMAMHIIQIAR